MSGNKRISHIYDSQCGRNDGAPLYTLEALKRREDVDVFHYLPKGDPSLWGKYDFHWVVDFADDALGYENFKFPKPYFYWSSDYHISEESYKHRLIRAKEAEWVGCYQKGNVNRFIEDGIPKDKVFWLPCAFEQRCYRPGSFNFKTEEWANAKVMKEYDIGFIGHINNEKRMTALDRVFKEFPNFFFGNKRFEKCAEIFNRSKIVFNTAHSDDINMRVFEAIGSGAFLLTEKVPYLDEIFKDGIHCATYSSIDEAIDKAKYYLKNDNKREEIAKAGYEEAIKKHTYDNRVETVLKYIKDRERAYASV